ncbi:2-hydroxy-3-oxopropionate reductase [Caldinitratiruptor microaerophilus]|uniref:2-hydroxy-3-oxopropionate reductase n=1 Tax=Caldinitratiruptor microaerophilus TaxID=671077 RepID=A0AA35CMK9_9FIRM|nr:2-hydroxy-3-oxopropionate reductase [Caldinitratiruptor microaerophilus]BDG61967.1 2-hydroxy-3-oxopropionate reductase [Caldinitratiruptor microaerophilus]
MERIGFIGLGIMGKPMARNLMKAGYPLVVHNRSRRPVDELAAEGATPASSPREVAEKSDVVITIVPDAPDVEAVILGPGGVAEGVRPGMLVIDMSTSSPVLARRIAATLGEKGVDVLDAPVSGGEIGAKEGTLSIMVGGSARAFERALPILQAMGKNIVHVGDAGAGQVTKAANQIVVGMTIQAVAEALLLASKAGVDPARVRQALMGGFAQSRILELHGQRMLDRNFKPGFKARLHRKDLAIALSTAREYGVPLPGTAVVHELLNGLIGMGRDEYDHSGLVTVLETLAQAEVKPQA